MFIDCKHLRELPLTPTMVVTVGMLNEVSCYMRKRLHSWCLLVAYCTLNILHMDDNSTGLETTQYTKTQIVSVHIQTILVSLNICENSIHNWKAKLESSLILVSSKPDFGWLWKYTEKFETNTICTIIITIIEIHRINHVGFSGRSISFSLWFQKAHS